MGDWALKTITSLDLVMSDSLKNVTSLVFAKGDWALKNITSLVFIMGDWALKTITSLDFVMGDWALKTITSCFCYYTEQSTEYLPKVHHLILLLLCYKPAPGIN